MRMHCFRVERIFSNGFVSILLFAIFLPLFLGCPCPTCAEAGESHIAVSPASRDFGAKPIGKTVSCSFRVSNKGAASLTIGAVTLDGDGDFTKTTDKCSGVTIKPKGSCAVNLLFTPSSPGVKTATMNIPSGGPDTPEQTVALTGTGEKTIAVSPASRDFGAKPIGKSASCSFKVSNKGVASLTIGAVTLDGDGDFTKKTDKCSGATIKPKGSCVVNLLFAPSSQGVKTADMNISSDDPYNPEQTVALTGTGMPELIPIAAFEGGKLYRTSRYGINVVVLNGTWREMGRQYGHLLKKQMNAYYQMFDFIDYAAAEREYKAQLPGVHDLIAGMVETTGFSLQKQKVISNHVTVDARRGGCSEMAAWGEYTGDGTLIQGRNLDMPDPYPQYRQFVTVVVYNPTESANSVVDVTFAGAVEPMTAMNSRGVYVGFNSSQISNASVNTSQKYGLMVLFDALLKYGSIEEIDGALFDDVNLPSRSSIINVADEKEGRVYEWTIHGGKRRTGNGIIASSNHFIDPDWGAVPSAAYGAPYYSVERLANLLFLGNKFYKEIDASRMKQIFDTTIYGGGPTLPDSFFFKTILQVVAAPSERIIWLKTPGRSDWEKISLKPLFSR
jgi:hypothetical protein